jgi:hypothetical protein
MCQYTVDDSCLNYFLGLLQICFEEMVSHVVYRERVSVCVCVSTHQSPFGDIICCCYALMCHFNRQYDVYRIQYY